MCARLKAGVCACPCFGGEFSMGDFEMYFRCISGSFGVGVFEIMKKQMKTSVQNKTPLLLTITRFLSGGPGGT